MSRYIPIYHIFVPYIITLKPTNILFIYFV